MDQLGTDIQTLCYMIRDANHYATELNTFTALANVVIYLLSNYLAVYIIIFNSPWTAWELIPRPLAL